MRDLVAGLLRILRTWCASAVLLPPDVSASLAEQLWRLFRQYLAVEILIEEGRGRRVPLIPQTPARHLPATPGLGEMDAAAYLAGLGSHGRFHRAAEI